jgi:hypothetical protein
LSAGKGPPAFLIILTSGAVKMKKYFNELMSIEETRNLFKQYCIQLHPDKPTGNHEEFCVMKSEYESIIKKLSSSESSKDKPQYNFKGEQSIMDILEAVIRIKNLDIEVCGSWIWVSGDTKPAKDRLKDIGFKWSKGKNKWYYSPYMGQKKKRGRYSMSKIRNKYGSWTAKSTEKEQALLSN